MDAHSLAVPCPRGRDVGRTPRPWWRWIVRYGPAEAVGTAAGLGTLLLVENATGSIATGAIAGAAAENLGFYGVCFARELVARRRESDRSRSGGSLWRRVARQLLLEFGGPELLDLLLLRPLCLAMAVGTFGPSVGGLVGKGAADLLFYGHAVMTHERHRSRDRRVSSCGPPRRLDQESSRDIP